ncbi:hypothetical protein EVAR_27006_1 [Eumeta japonica]|uniref:Uncharacterized protein n=1 Tax=Eumeta variegata TaxID=151549 RepID=A0A4C1Z1S7_EUMVA|nr:hypothetical protein EVAR_27006_1 [Eumeta japonica]
MIDGLAPPGPRASPGTARSASVQVRGQEVAGLLLPNKLEDFQNTVLILRQLNDVSRFMKVRLYGLVRLDG